ncbi:HigA family addiction module antitoxin [Mycobacterium sp. PSTR-4-N]|uniref:HigA family addiction module antitoxin n=1 Tax=Mycobacterium sp. PSTR-4-N TaxID=2917745 RepID=UPI001F14E3D4|nr:HigA family addiction module antitoxin [Mycobacterium sp. PSTR-4-N]MCG7592402.1 HigA family addiction module antitoxin [Mycobacterium sp. PSTR-4-N]
MTASAPVPFDPDWTVHPGRILQQEIDARGWTQKQFAEIIDRPVQAVNEICTGKKRITAQTALVLGAALGVDAMFWLTAQARYDLDVALGKRAQ